MASYLPISEISTYQKGWAIRGRITSKCPIRVFGKAGGGKVFSASVLDASGAEIKANFFNQAAEQLYEKLQSGRCYALSKGTVRVANRQYNSTNHKYELVFDKTWQAEEVADDAQIQSFKFSISGISSLRTRKVPCKVDLCGVVTEARALMSMTAKDGTELAKREIMIADDTGCSINVVLWGDKAKIEDAALDNHPVVGLKNVLIKEWHGALSGSVLPEGDVALNPAIVEATKARRWWAEGGASQSLVAISQPLGQGDVTNSRIVNLAELAEAVPGVTGQTVFIVFCRLHCVQVRRQGEPMPLYYSACQENKGNGSFTCNKRVDGAGFCVACNRTVKHALRLNIRCHFSDSKDSNWIGTFHDPAVQILGMDADEMCSVEFTDGGREALEASIQQQYYGQPFQLMVRARLDNFNGEPRVSVGCYDACPVDPGDRGREMLEEIRQMIAA